MSADTQSVNSTIRGGDLDGLIRRLEEAAEADRWIDIGLWAVSTGRVLRVRDNGLVTAHVPGGVLEERMGIVDPGETARNFYGAPDFVPAYTASLDAAEALTRTLLPGYGWLGGRARIKRDDRPYAYQIFAADCSLEDEGPPDVIAQADHHTAALAFCLAACRALSANEAGHGPEGSAQAQTEQPNSQEG